MVKTKIDDAVDESSVDRKICKLDATVHNLWKFWKPAPSGTGLTAGRLTKFGQGLKFLKLCCRSKYSIFRFV